MYQNERPIPFKMLAWPYPQPHPPTQEKTEVQFLNAKVKKKEINLRWINL